MNNIIFVVGILITLVMGTSVLMQMRHHPKGLFVCFFAEMWERFSYYGMRALLIYYITKHFLFSDQAATSQYGSYTTLIYLMPLLGGIVADRWIGTRRAVMLGGVLLVIGHLTMAIEAKPNIQTLTYHDKVYEFTTGATSAHEPRLKLGDQTYAYKAAEGGGIEFVGLPENAEIPAIMPKGSYSLGKKVVDNWGESVFFLAISFIVMGVGFLKPNISALVGQLYPDRDPRRDPGFQLYYFGINLGSFWASFFCGLLGETVGWWAGFGLAGLGMLAGLLWFWIGKPQLMGKGEAPNIERLKTKVAGPFSLETLIYGLGFAGVILVYFVIQKNEFVGMMLTICSVAILGYVIYTMVTQLNRIENMRLILAMTLTLGSVVFWSLFEQAGSSLSTFADRNTDLNYLSNPIVFDAFGKTIALASKEQLAALSLPVGHLWIDMGINAAQTQTFNPGFILVFAPIFAAIFTFLGKRGIDPDPVKKFAFALLFAGLGFLFLVWTAPMANGDFKLPILFLMTTYLLHTWGELALSPVGLSQQTKLSPPILVATMMAIWFMGTSWGQYLAGFIAGFTSTETIGGQVLDPKAALETSLSTFKTIGMASVALAAVFFGLSFVIGKWDHGANSSKAAAE